MAAISRTRVEGTWLKMLRYQCTTHRCQAASGKNSAALSASPRQADDQPHTLEPALLEMLEEAAPARLVLPRRCQESPGSPRLSLRSPPAARHCGPRPPSCA